MFASPPFAVSFVAGFLASLALIVAIGAQNAFVLRQGLRGEHLLPVALICAFSDALLIAIGIAGLGQLIEAHPAALGLARYGGAAFLVYCGWRALQSARHGERLTVDEGRSASRAAAIATCLGFTFLNPHVYIDTVILLGGLANQHGDSGRWAFGLGSFAASVSWFFALAYGARLLVPLFARPAAWRVLDTGIALVMFGLALGLVSAR